MSPGIFTVPLASRTGTDDGQGQRQAEAQAFGNLDEPAVFRNPRSEANARINQLAQKGVDRLDIPAFLRRQAD